LYCIFNSTNEKHSDELAMEQVTDALIQLKERGFMSIKFTGGEPFVRRDMISILEKSKELGFDVDVSTNGSLITSEMAQELKRIGVDMIHVSLDGHNGATHEKVRGDDTFERTIRGIKHLTSTGLYVRLGALIYTQNEHNIEDIIELAISLKANEIVFSFMEAIGRLKDDVLISKRKIQDVKDEITLLQGKYCGKIEVKYSFTETPSNNHGDKCPAVDKFLYINNLGEISPCTWVVGDNPAYKSKLSLRENSLDDILNSQPIKSYLKYIGKSGIIGCPVQRRA